MHSRTFEKKKKKKKREDTVHAFVTLFFVFEMILCSLKDTRKIEIYLLKEAELIQLKKPGRKGESKWQITFRYGV